MMRLPNESKQEEHAFPELRLCVTDEERYARRLDVDSEIAALSEAPQATDEFARLRRCVWRLRQPGGCAWDREQTHESLKRNLIEEAYELIDAIDAADDEAMCEELGDVLEQVLIQAQIASDRHAFDIEDVAAGLNDKLIRRHPHVFDERFTDLDVQGIKVLWQQVKQAERALKRMQSDEGHQRGALSSIPGELPALLEAQKVSEVTAALGFDWEDTQGVMDQLVSECMEFAEAPEGSDEQLLELGDILFTVVNIARHAGLDAEAALKASTAKFRRRWEYVEQQARMAEVPISEAGTEQLNVWWQDAKECENYCD